MGFNLRIILHVLGILANVLVLAWCLQNTQYYATMLVLFLLLLVQLTTLLRFVHTTNRQLARFLEALKYLDFSQSFSTSGNSASFRELAQALNTVVDRFRASRSDKEQQAAYLQALVQHLPVAIVALDDEERVLMTNTSLLRLLGRNTMPGTLHAIAENDAALASIIHELQPGKERTLQLQRNADSFSVKVSCNLLRSGGRQQKLVSIQNIEGELESRELEAWQNLIRVMTHEIMNSVTPITSLADTAAHYVEESRNNLQNCTDNSTRESMQNLLDDTASAVGTIGKRSQALMRFVTSYRTLSRLPKPNPEWCQLATVFHQVQELLANQLKQANVNLQVTCQPANLQLYVDNEQLEQALINLLRNAMDAIADVQVPHIELKASLEDGGMIVMSVSDNGCGMSEENLQNIFVPFYTTKRGGSGIGMSMVKQIVRANGGRIRVLSESGKGTHVRIAFRHY